MVTAPSLAIQPVFTIVNMWDVALPTVNAKRKAWLPKYKLCQVW
jgi:hypothetical protein